MTLRAPRLTDSQPLLTRGYLLTTGLALLLACFSVLCRFSPAVAEFYATRLYPGISSTLSFLSSFSTVDLEQLTLVVIVLAILVLLCLACLRRLRWVRCLGYVASIVLWTYVWFYTSWCNLYSRPSLYVRASATRSDYDPATFRAFASDFILTINDLWAPYPPVDPQEVEAHVKHFYSGVAECYGLSSPRSWHHPKRMLFSRFYASVGIQGFMAPLYGESCINPCVHPLDYPFVAAHEYAHLMGVSSEAEANWWAFHVCRTSLQPAIRYSGYKGILSQLLRNARQCLTPEDYKQFFTTIRPEVIDDLRLTQRHWQQYLSPSLNELQEATFDTFLKSNNVKAGMDDYSLVIRLLIDVAEPS